MSMQREFLDWTRPCLSQAADRIIRRAGSGTLIDLRRVLCVLPGARAGRLLLAQLLDSAQQASRQLLPPRVLTPGAMVDQLLSPGGASATDAETLLAWLHVLRSVDSSA